MERDSDSLKRSDWSILKEQLDIRHDIPLAKIDSCDDLGEPTPVPTAPNTPALQRPLRSEPEDEAAEGDTYSIDMEQEERVRARAPLVSMVVLCATLVFLGILLLIVALALTSHPLNEYPALVGCGIALILIGVIISLITVGWCLVKRRHFRLKANRTRPGPGAIATVKNGKYQLTNTSAEDGDRH